MNFKHAFALPIAFFSFPAKHSFANSDLDASKMGSAYTAATPSKGGTVGSVGFDSSGFLYTSNARGTSATTLRASLNSEGNSQYFKSKANLELYTFVTENADYGIESKELYLETQPGTLGNLQVSLGRKKYDWSKVDQNWRMMSLWSPRWTWDELHPDQIGMTGVFAEYKSSNFEVMAFGSPIAIPERGTNTKEKNGAIVSSNPLWRPPTTQANVMDQPTNIRYRLDMPGMNEILLRPNFGIKAKAKFGDGFFASGNAGVLPVHMAQLAAEPKLASNVSSNQLDVTIKPQFPMRNINTLELGYESEKDEWDAWVSGSYEQPFQYENKDTWLNPIITPSTVISAGSSVQLTSNFRFNGSVLVIREESFRRSGSLPDVDVGLPSRFPLKQGIQVGGTLKFSELTHANANWIQDTVNQNHFVSAEVQHYFYRSRITLGGGLDLILANNTQGWVGSYYGNDRLRGWLKYAF